MSTVLMILLAIASIILIASILMQSSNSTGLSGSIGGGAEQLFGKKKSKAYDVLFARITAIAAICFVILSLVLVAIQ